MPQPRKQQRVVAIALLALALAATTVQAKPLGPSTGKERIGWMAKTHRAPTLPPNSAFFIAIGRCEQPAPTNKRLPSGRWRRGYEWGINWHHPGPSYPGGLGVWAPLWLERDISGRGFASSPDRATPMEQMIHAQMIVNKYGAYAWGCTGVALAQAKIRNVSSRELRHWIRLARQGAPTIGS